MQEVKTSKGVLKFKSPDVFQNHEFLRSARPFFAADDAIGAKIQILKDMGPLIDYSGIEGVTSYEQLCSMGDEMTLPLTNIADKIWKGYTGL